MRVTANVVILKDNGDIIEEKKDFIIHNKYIVSAVKEHIFREVEAQYKLSADECGNLGIYLEDE